MCKHDYCWQCLADYSMINVAGSVAHLKTCRYYSAQLHPEEDYEEEDDQDDYSMFPGAEDEYDEYDDTDNEDEESPEDRADENTPIQPESTLRGVSNFPTMATIERSFAAPSAQADSNPPAIAISGPVADSDAQSPEADSSILSLPIRQPANVSEIRHTLLEIQNRHRHPHMLMNHQSSLLQPAAPFSEPTTMEPHDHYDNARDFLEASRRSLHQRTLMLRARRGAVSGPLINRDSGGFQ